MYLLQGELLLAEKAMNGRFSSSGSLKYIFIRGENPTYHISGIDECF